MLDIEVSHEKKRGCGFRKGGGFYLVTDPAKWRQCENVPMELKVCPCCGQGFKYSRAFSWINPAKILELREYLEKDPLPLDCERDQHKICPFNEEKAGLIWVGKSFYDCKAFVEEARTMGISRRIKSVPRGFKVGETWIFLAHLKAYMGGGEWRPGIFLAFRPQRIEYVLKGDEDEKKLQKMQDQGITLVKVIKEDPNGSLDLKDDGEDQHPNGDHDKGWPDLPDHLNP